MNITILTGTLGKDPEIRSSQNGTYVVFRIALDSEGGGGKIKAKTHWVSATSFSRRVAEYAKKLKKGKRILLKGKLKTNNEGNIIINIDEIGVVPPKRSKQQTDQTETENVPQEERPF